MALDVTRWLRILATRDESEGALGRHGALLISLLLLLFVLPLVQFVSGTDLGLPFFFGLVLITAVLVNSRQRWLFRLSLLLGAAAILGSAGAELLDSQPLLLATDVVALTLLAFTTLVMLNSLIQTRSVSGDTVVGGICVYLLVGLCFAMAYVVMNKLSPGSFGFDGVPMVFDPGSPNLHAARLLYFSFVTLTTLGYGDITPESELAHMFAVAEAVIGQLYLTIFVARLVALFVSDSTRA